MKLARGQRRWVDWSGSALVISGVLWLGFHHFVRVQGEFGPGPHPLESWWLRVHGAAAMLALIVSGSLLPVHVRRGWHQRVNRAWGIALCTVLVLLTLTGYGLYYLGGERWREMTGIAHWAIGLACPIIVVLHVRAGRSARRQPSRG